MLKYEDANEYSKLRSKNNYCIELKYIMQNSKELKQIRLI